MGVRFVRGNHINLYWKFGRTRPVWLKEVAPSTELRKWFGHDPGKWVEFQRRYRLEVNRNSEAVSLLNGKAAEGPVTLLYGAKDEKHNEAVVLQAVLSS